MENTRIKNITCDMALDLIALYFDGAASEDSRRAVDAHLETCKSCADAYARYKAGLELGHHRTHAPTMTGRKYAEIAESLRLRHQKKVLGVVCLVALSMLLGSLTTAHLLGGSKAKEKKR